MADRVMAHAAAEVYDAEPPGFGSPPGLASP